MKKYITYSAGLPETYHNDQPEDNKPLGGISM